MTDLAWTCTVHHDPSPAYVSGGPLTLGAVLRVRLRAGRDAPLAAVLLRTSPDGEQHIQPMTPAGEDAACRWWEADLRLAMRLTNYRFYLVTHGGETFWLTAAGVLRHTPHDAADFKLLADFAAPDWVRDSVFYQIFPDRFADGDPDNNVRSGEYLCYGRPVISRAWGELPSTQHPGGSIEFYGGDLPGVIQRLDYLQDLGVTALYLNPIFVSPSNHKYDVSDYEHVDPHFGGDAALIALREALDARGMRLMLDIVPNHCSAVHPWFLAAQADPAAATAPYFTFRQRPDQYETWLGVRSLPKLNYASETLREQMYAGPDAVMRRWLRPPFRIDGWRIDVANMLARQGQNQFGHKIGRGMRRAVKAESAQAYLVGEHFYDGTPHLQGDELDAVMNYRGFAFPLLYWLAGFDMTGAPPGQGWQTRPPLPTEALADQWRTFLAAVPWQVAVQQFNLLGSHDTPRLMTVVGRDTARARVAAALLFTYPGVPCVYYGDEIGLEGGRDPDCRRCMPWDAQAWNHDLRAFFQQMIRLRRTSPALREGGFQLLYAAGDTLAFLREAPAERCVIVARRGGDGLADLPVRAAGLPDGTRLRDAISGAEATVRGGMLPLGSAPGPLAQVWQVI